MALDWLKSLTIALVFAVIAGIISLAFVFLFDTWNIGIVLLMSFIFIGIQWYFGPTVVRMVTGAKPFPKEQYPEIPRMVEELSRKANLPKTPELLIVNERSPNAFAFGRTKSSSAIGVHSGLLELLERDEIEGVLAHEIGHIANNDSVVMTLASSLPVILYYSSYFFFSGNNDRRSLYSVVAGFAMAMVARLIGQVIVAWLSRQREFSADQFSKSLTNNPMAFSRALAKITYASALIPSKAGSAMSSFYIASPSAHDHMLAERVAQRGGSIDSDRMIEEIQKEKGRESSWLYLFSSHPPTYKRLERLLN